MDLLSKSDPVLFLFKRHGNLWNKLGSTEIIYDTLNPQFVTKLTVDYNFEMQDLFKVEIYDIDDDQDVENLKKQDYMGWCEFYIHEITANPQQKMRKKIINPTKPFSKGFLVVYAEEIQESANQDICTFNPTAHIFSTGISHYFFMILKQR